MPEELPPRSRAKQALRAIGGPLVVYSDRRFSGVHEHLDDRIDRLGVEMGDRFDQLHVMLASETEILSELSLSLQRFAELFVDRVEELTATIQEQLAGAAPNGATENGTTDAESTKAGSTKGGAGDEPGD
jgi:hypothetical protein